MPTRNLDLTEHFDEFVAAGVEAGRYSDASDVVRAGLRLLEKQEQEDTAKIEWLRETSKEAFAALDRGEGIRMDSDADIDTFLGDIMNEMRAERAATNA